MALNPTELAKAIRNLQTELEQNIFVNIDKIKDSAGNEYFLYDEFLSPVKSNLDIALSTLDSDLKSRLPRELELDDGSGTYGKIYRTGNALNIQIKGDDAGLAKETTLSSIKTNTDNLDIALSSLDSDLKSRLPREIELDDGSGTYDKLHRSGNALLISINEDKIGILKKGDLNFDANGYLNVNAQVVANPSNLDIALSDLRDALKGADARTLTDLYNKIDSLLSEFQPVSTSGSVAAADNTSGFEISLDKGGRPFVEVYYNVGDAADIYIEISRDGSTWRPLDSVSPSAADEDTLQYPWVSHRYVRVRTPTTNIDVEFEISASR